MEATSSISPVRCMGMAAVSARKPASPWACSVAGVRTRAGAMALQVMPVAAYSLPITLVIPMTAALEVE